MIRGLLGATVGRAAGVARGLLENPTANPSPGMPAGATPVASKANTTDVDDLDDTAAAETISFALDGNHYEIDLSSAHAAALRADLKTWVEHARRTTGTPRRPAPQKGGSRAKPVGRNSTARQQPSTVREWARANGHDVSDRGRIPAAVQQAFDDAH